MFLQIGFLSNFPISTSYKKLYKIEKKIELKWWVCDSTIFWYKVLVFGVHLTLINLAWVKSTYCEDETLSMLIFFIYKTQTQDFETSAANYNF